LRNDFNLIKMKLKQQKMRFDRAFSNINKLKSNEMHLDSLIYRINPTYMFRPAPAIFRVVL
jgi:hypothetical protein